MTGNVVLGLGGTVDYEIAWDSAVLEDLVARYGITAAELSTSVEITDERDLVRSVLAFVRDGVGGERFVASSQIVETFAARFARRVTLGGTCVRAALAMTRLGVPSTVHLVSIDDHVRRLLPPEVDYLCSAAADSTDPHLIVQFPAGARVRSGDVDLRAPHPNRLIYVNDLPNRELVLSPDLGDVLRTADVVLVSGFNTIQDAELLDTRLRELREHLRSLPPHAVVVYEDAGFHVPAMSTRVRGALLDVVDVYSLNEDEMQAYVGRPVDLLDADDVTAGLGDLRGVVPARTLVVHTKYWSVALGERAPALGPALRGGVTMASTRYVHGDELTAADYARVATRPVHEGGRAVCEALASRFGEGVTGVPAFVLDVASPTTIGLGDSFVGGFLAALVRGDAGPGTGTVTGAAAAGPATVGRTSGGRAPTPPAGPGGPGAVDVLDVGGR